MFEVYIVQWYKVDCYRAFLFFLWFSLGWALFKLTILMPCSLTRAVLGRLGEPLEAVSWASWERLGPSGAVSAPLGDLPSLSSWGALGRLHP